MTDRIVDLLVGFEERFDQLGHDTIVEVTQLNKTPITLMCRACSETAKIHILNGYGGWRLDESLLDRECT